MLDIDHHLLPDIHNGHHLIFSPVLMTLPAAFNLYTPLNVFFFSMRHD
jgi:hypothetical protein